MKLKNFIQRGKRGWCPQDTWNLDVYLSKVISESVKHLRENTVSYPHEMSFRQWKKILKQISEDIVIKDYFQTEKEQLTAYKKRKEALRLFAIYFNNLWD